MPPQLTLSHKLKEIVETNNVSIRSMQRETGINRNKLGRLMEGDENQSFTMKDLVEIDRWLRGFGESLVRMNMFQPPRFFSELAAIASDIRVYCAAHHRTTERVVDYSAWDIDAYLSLADGFREVRRVAELVKIDTPYNTTTYGQPADLAKQLKVEEPSIVIAVGSPRMNMMSEAVLRRIYSREVASPPGFLWLDGRASWESKFVLKDDELEQHELDALHEDPVASAIRCGDEVRVCVPASTEYRSYGILACRWLPAKRTLLVSISGLNGPATLGICKALGDLDEAVGELERHPERVLTCLYEVNILQKPGARDLDLRQVGKTALLTVSWG